MPVKKRKKSTVSQQKHDEKIIEAAIKPAVSLSEGQIPAPKSLFPIVGIGASAGGLEALEQFFSRVPPTSGMAFVIVQHLDPTHKGIMPELLQRMTEIKVCQVRDRMRVQPNCVYIIPPNKDMSILHGVLHLLVPMAPRGLRLPIDFFLRSLAADRLEHSVGVILSGMGTDGTLGLRALKEKAGAVFVQDPTNAKFDGMPLSAVNAGLADVVAPAEELFERINSYLRHTAFIAKPETPFEEKTQGTLEKIFVLLRAQTGHDFSLYKKSTIYRRIERRMGIHQLDKISAYLRFLQENVQEVHLLFKELLIGVTSFFRDPEAWDQLKNEVIPALLENHPAGQPLRAWSAGCSSGEEAYSLAMAFNEALDKTRQEKNIALQIFATDLDKDAIEIARTGAYPANISADVTPERLRRFFIKEEAGFRVSKAIREMVTFAPQNIVMDPPFTKLDLLICRNLLIYLAPELQKKLLPLFHYSLNPGGILFLGSAETIGTFTDLFTPLNSKTRIYRRLDSALQTEPIKFPAAFPTALPGRTETVLAPHPALTLPSQVEHLLLQQYSPPAILTNDKGDILYISGRTGKYLEPAAGKANWNIFAMAREGLRFELSNAFQRALRQKEQIVVKGIKVGTNGGTQTVNLTLQPLKEPETLRGMVLIVFTDVAEPPLEKRKPGKPEEPPGRHVHLSVLEKELQRTRDELQTTREKMQTSQEELKSTNEELQSTNEELQSTNEELTTSKEEMQSMNEELQTVNHELQSKVDELTQTSDDMKNLLNSTDIATLFLDNEFNVRRFTTQTAGIIKLIPTDVGRPITDISSNLLYPEMTEDVRQVLQTLIFVEKQVAARDGRWFNVRIMPYRTAEDRIDGVVITFTDITVGKSLEGSLREKEDQLRQLMESLPLLVWTCRPDGFCDYASPQWLSYTGISEPEILGYGWLQQVHPEDRERTRSMWMAGIKTEKNFEMEFRLRSKEGTYRWFKARAVPIRDAQGKIRKWYGSNMDSEEQKRAESAPAPGDNG